SGQRRHAGRGSGGCGVAGSRCQRERPAGARRADRRSGSVGQDPHHIRRTVHCGRFLHGAAGGDSGGGRVPVLLPTPPPTTRSPTAPPPPAGPEARGRSRVTVIWAGARGGVLEQTSARGPGPVRSDQRLTDSEGSFAFRFTELPQHGWSYAPEP